VGEIGVDGGERGGWDKKFIKREEKGLGRKGQSRGRENLSGERVRV
jgi:hypothetical protein